jgi:hypothetical protein
MRVPLLCLALLGCSNSSSTTSTSSSSGGPSPPNPSETTTGLPCTPSQEALATFAGSSEQEVGYDTNAPACSGGTCIENHFRGRTTCPYGQDDAGNAPDGASPCTLPDGGAVASAVIPQCADRRATATVYCSCRCANADGKTDDGASYCACPQGFACQPFVVSFGSNASTAGSYCLRQNTTYDRANACLVSCTPSTCK